MAVDHRETKASSSSSLRLILPSLKGTILVSGIYIFFLAFGYFQESVFRVGNKETKDTFRYPTFLVSVLCVGNVFISAVHLLLDERLSSSSKVEPPEVDDAGLRHKLVSPTIRSTRKKPSFIQKYVLLVDREALKDIALTALTYVGSMLATNYALQHVSYPTQVLVKSAKSVPVILGGFFIFGKRYPAHDYFAVVVVTLALAGFNLSNLNRAKAAHDQTLLGNVLLIASLLCDAMTGPRQDHLLARVRISSSHLMFLTNVFGSVIAATAALLIEGLQPLQFCSAYPEVVAHIAMFCLCAALGQFFIFASLTAFGSLYLTLITTTRKFFTVLLSVLVFGHHISASQWLCVIAVFTALAAQSYLSKKLKATKEKAA